MRPTPRASRRPASRRLTTSLAACAVALVVGVVGCTGDDDSGGATGVVADPGGRPPASGTEPGIDLPDQAPVQVQVKNVWGRWPGLGSKQTDQLAKRAGSAVIRWMGKAFVGLDYPTDSDSRGGAEVAAAFATFTSGAARQAQRQLDLTTNLPAGRELVDVVATRRLVRLIAYAPRGIAVGATASVQLVLVGAAENGRQTETAVSGELYLTRVGAGWRVFGYDLHRSGGAPGSYARAHQPTDKPSDKPGDGGGDSG